MKKTNYKKAEPTLDEFYDDMTYIFGKWSINKMARALGVPMETLRLRAKKSKGEK